MRPATVAIWLLGILPTVIAALVILPGVTWTSPQSVLTALGRLTGVAGLGFLLVSACLSSRVPGFDRHFGGLTKLWQTHHLLGAFAFLLLLSHPILLAMARGDSPAAAARMLVPPLAEWGVWVGWAGLILMMIFLAPSFAFFSQPYYQRWKATHMLAGPAIAFALLHAFVYDRAIPAPFDYIVWGTLSLLALAALGYRWVFSRRYLPGPGGRFPYRVEGVDAISQGVVELSLQPVSRALRYEAGQFVYLTPFDKSLPSGYGEEHPFTISSAPTETQLRITIKDLGDASRALQRIQRLSDVRIEGPYGAFFAKNSGATPELWIAGGIGITPFISRARAIRHEGKSPMVDLIYCVQDEARTLFLDELNAIADEVDGFQVHIHYFYQQGPLDRAFIEAHCDNVVTRAVYICGPTPLLTLAHKLISDLGVPDREIHTEEFNLL